MSAPAMEGESDMSRSSIWRGDVSQPTLITFDGFCGSGKSTQSRRLNDYLVVSGEKEVFVCEKDPAYANLNKISHLLLQAQSLISKGYDSRLIGLIDRMTQIQVKFHDRDLWGRYGIFLSDWYWDAIIHYAQDDDILDAFMKVASADGAVLPSLSFLLQISLEECNKRLRVREADRVMMMTDKSILFSEDDTYYENARWLSSKLDFFHVIDGMKSEDEVFEDILAIYKEQVG